jgi:8-oxo-dGTP diphosphatase
MLVIKLRVLSAAFLSNGDELLLMRRFGDRRLFPGRWAALGGHIEPFEMSNPEAACLRELREEAGLLPDDVLDLQLRYVINRLAGNEIRVQYVCFGSVRHRRLPGYCNEGELHWIDRRQALLLDTSFTTREILKHSRTDLSKQQSAIYTGTVGVVDQKPVIIWSPLQDWE